MKKALIIAYSFPPAENACAGRADSFVKQLNSYGWEPLVLTGNARLLKASDAKIGNPDGIDIVRTRSWRPENLPVPLRYAAALLAALQIPDRERLWELSCIKKAIRLAKSEGADLIYTLSPPSSAHLIGLRIKKKLPGIPWVADFCTAEDAAVRGLKKYRNQYERKLTASVLNEADCVITSNRTDIDLLSNMGGSGQQAEIYHVPDGYVQELTELFEKACRTIAARKMKKEIIE